MNREEALKKIEELREYVENCDKEPLVYQVEQLFNESTHIKPNRIHMGNESNVVIIDYEMDNFSSLGLDGPMGRKLHDNGFFVTAIGHNPCNEEFYHRVWLEKYKY